MEGRDYTVMQRVRFMDNDGFQEPAEAFSVLLPRDWKHEGGIRWGSLQQCRGELVTAPWSAASPDGAIRFVALPLRTWGGASDPMMQQSMMMQAQQGGCAFGEPMEAERYLRQVLAGEMDGASVTAVQDNATARAELDAQSQRTRNAIMQYGGQAEVRNSAVNGTLQWPNGDQGIALVSVMNIFITMQDMYTGGFQQLSTSVAAMRSYIRFPAGRKAEAEQVLATIQGSYRTNPAWKQAVEQYMEQMRNRQDILHRERIAAIDAQTRANTAAHNRRMADIRAQGQANTARHEQRMDAMDAQMRSWERQQSSQDRQHKAFVQTIREVETWKDASGTAVEMSAGYDQAWSRGDGTTYILSNKPGFDPAAIFQDRNWTEMKRADP